MSKYLIYYGSKLPKYANKDEYGFISNPFAEGGMLEVLNPATALNFYAKKGVSSLPGALVKELKDYDEVRDTISNRPKVLRKAAKKLRDTPFNDSKRKIINYRGSGWSNILSQSPTSQSEAYAIVASMYYITANIYNKPELLSQGDKILSRSESASTEKDVKKSLDILNKGVKKLNSDAKKAGAIPAWYNIVGQVDKIVKEDTAFDSLNKYAKAMNSKDEIEFAEAMRAARMEDSSPLGQLLGTFGIAIGGIILTLTAPYWIPVVGKGFAAAGKAIPGIARGAGKIATKGAKGAGKIASKTAKSAGRMAKNTATDMVKDISTDLIEKTKDAVENFDVEKFNQNVSSILQNMQKQGKMVSQEAVMQSQQFQNLFQKYLENSNNLNKEATKQEMKKLLMQLLKDIKSQEK